MVSCFGVAVRSTVGDLSSADGVVLRRLGEHTMLRIRSIIFFVFLTIFCGSAFSIPELVCAPGVLADGTTYYATIFVGSDNDYFNLVFDKSRPYPTSGHPYPSGSFPIFRQFK